MAKNKMKVCKHCGAEIATSAKVCPYCGGKNKPPFYQRPWFIALVVILVIGIIGGGSGSTKNSDVHKVDEVSSNNITQETTGNSYEKASEEVKTVYNVGDILQDGDMKIVYIASGDYYEDNQFLQPKEGNKLVYLKFAFINEGKSDKSISFYNFDAYADGYACEMHYSTDETLSATLSAGRSTSGTIAFEVPTDAQDIEIEYSPNAFSSKKVKFVFEGDKDSGYVLEANTTRTDDAYNVGDVIEGKNVNITYLSCEPYTSDNMYIQPKAGYHYMTVELEFENTGTSDKTVSFYSFDCYADGAACDQMYARDDALSGTISAGRKIRGTVTFEVPDNAEVIEVEYNDNLWTSHRIVFTVK
ncbi:MAG: DUF4352 domain-containing protein [Erysipelotrichaceae bacterium]|nr:DUF4352 domain-containing protein [Erysipelotrichaceae bacterium]